MQEFKVPKKVERTTSTCLYYAGDSLCGMPEHPSAETKCPFKKGIECTSKDGLQVNKETVENADR